ncbi:MAG: hypothetical protein DHS20C01_33630 [marine bacterium B5-7]|nr:MAG: hypothetical protein DHS20C01_33630 [marine bacterium B5-7]
MNSSNSLGLIKLIHTVVWVIFAGCILAIFVFSYFGSLNVSKVLIAVVAVEVIILALNRGSCPLTVMAARYTQDRQDNFDICLPRWLARYNKVIFGTLYITGIVYTFLLWVKSRGL